MTVTEGARAIETRSGPDGSIATVTMQNPPVNALGPQLRAELTATFRRFAAAGSDVRVVILRGAQGRFCAGGDIHELARRGGPADDRSLHESFAALYDAVSGCPVPVIAAIERYAMGGGFELALRCDLRYGAPTTRFAASGVNMGLVESAHTLGRTMSSSHAAELLYTGDTIDGARAAVIGLMTRTVPAEDLDGYVTTVATRIATRPPRAVREAKAVLRLAAATPAADNAAAAGWLELRATGDHAEALRAFLDHTDPRFEGR